MLKADSFNFLFFFSLLSLSLSFFPFLVRARHIPPFCAVHLQRSAPTLLRARFSVLRAKRAPRGLTAHQTLALTLDRSPFGRVFFDSAGSTPFHALPTPRISRFSQARDRERYIYIYRERVKKRRFLFERTLLIKRARLLLRFDAEERRWITLEPKLVRFEGRSVRCVSTSARCTGRESERERVRVRGGEREREALDLGTVLRVRYHSHTRE